MKKHYLFSPGPTPVPPEAALEEAQPIIRHRTSEFASIFQELSEGLKYVFKTFIKVSSGTGVMESSVVNLLSPGIPHW